MKLIKVYDQEFMVEDWAKYIAIDEDGLAAIFTHKPYYSIELNINWKSEYSLVEITDDIVISEFKNFEYL